MVDTVSITLLRHGLTDENEQSKYLGWTDSSLNEKGQRQLVALKEQNYPKPEILFTSDLKRCKQTAEILFPDIEYNISPLFREYHFGKWDTLTYDQLKDDKQYRGWIDNPYTETPPEGESFVTFKDRVLAGYKELLTYFDHDRVRNITLITHGGPIRLLLSEFAPVQKEFWEWSAPYGQGYVLYLNREDLRGMRRCTLLQEAPLTES